MEDRIWNKAKIKRFRTFFFHELHTEVLFYNVDVEEN